MEKKKNILLDNYLVKNLRAYPVLKKKFMHYIEGTKELPEGFTKRKLFHDYLKVRRNNPEKRVSQSEYMIFGFYGLSPEEQKMVDDFSKQIDVCAQVSCGCAEATVF